MTEEGIWITDPETEQEIFLSYDEIPDEARWQLFKPIGGFIYPANQFVQLDLPKVPFYIQDWLPKRGKCLLYAPTKTGKSFITYQVARAIGCGLPFLGMETSQGRVLLVQFELGIEIFQSRLQKTGLDYSNIFVGTTFSLKLDKDSGFNLLDKAMNAVEPDVLILDPLYKMISGDENNTPDMEMVVDTLDFLIDKYKTSLFLIHHSGKDLSKGARGNSVLEDWVDTALEMKKVSADGERLRARITPKLLRHAENPPEPMIIQLNSNYEFELCPKEVKEKVVRVIDEVEAFLVSQYNIDKLSVTTGELLKLGIGSNTSVSSALKTLCEQGKAMQIARGEYLWKGE